MGDNDDTTTLIKWKNAIISILEGESTQPIKNKKKKTNNMNDNDHDNVDTVNNSNKSQQQQQHDEEQQQQLKVKKLRKLVLLSMQFDEDDKAAKKAFKHTIQTLEMENTIHLHEDGHITLKKKKKKKNNDKKRRNRENDDDGEYGKKSKMDVHSNEAQHRNENGEDNNTSSNMDSNKEKNVPCSGNPQGITRLFVGNLSFQINETILEEFLPGLTHVKWITDKESGKFYGSAFIEMLTSKHAADAITNKAGQLVLGRPIKINYAPALPNDKWPPEKKVITGGSSNSSNNTSTTTTATDKPTTKRTAGGVGITAMSVKPENCCKLFIGNLSYEITDEVITKFFASVDAEVKAIRWIHHKDTGDFKGVGFVEFWNTDACEKAATLNGKNLLGRPIRIDWTD